jgi:hypothetical protein
MEPSTLVLAALSLLNEQIRDNDAFCGYEDNWAGTSRLLDELWELYTANSPKPANPNELVCAWLEELYPEELEA